jgi:hypothetical protein
VLLVLASFQDFHFKLRTIYKDKKTEMKYIAVWRGAPGKGLVMFLAQPRSLVSVAGAFDFDSCGAYASSSPVSCGPESSGVAP